MNSTPSRCPPSHPAPLPLCLHPPLPPLPQLLRVQGEVRSPLIQVVVADATGQLAGVSTGAQIPMPGTMRRTGHPLTGRWRALRSAGPAGAARGGGNICWQHRVHYKYVTTPIPVSLTPTRYTLRPLRTRFS